MVSKRQKVIAVTVIAIMILAGTAFILSNQTPEQSISEKMILQPGDIGPGWSSSNTPQFPMDQVNESSICRAELGNSTIGLYLRIDVFNSSNDSCTAFLKLLPGLIGGYQNITLGDEAVYYPQGTSLPGVIFTRSNTLAWVQTQSFSNYTWQKNATIAIALLQLDKIDQYLAK